MSIRATTMRRIAVAYSIVVIARGREPHRILVRATTSTYKSTDFLTLSDAAFTAAAWQR